MRGYDWGTGTVRCSFCLNYGHNITTCSHVYPTFKVLCNKLEAQPHYLPTSYERKAFEEMKRREEAKVKKRKPRRKSRCSFCGSTEHKRDRCSMFRDFKESVLNANKKWKLNFVNEANRAGFGVGSLVSIPIGVVDDYEPSIGIITGYHREKACVFSEIQNHFSIYYSEPVAHVMINNEEYSIGIPRLKGLGERYNRGWSYYEVISMSPCNWEPSEEWLSDDNNNTLKWFFGKVSMRRKDWEIVEKVINKWDKK